MYGSPYRCKNCVDSFILRDSEFCYECTDSSHLYNCYFCRNCNDSSNLYHCLGVEGSSDCFGCVGLINKHYCIFNVQYTKEEYGQKLVEMRKMNPEEIKKEIDILVTKVPQRCFIGTNNDRVEGNYIFNSSQCTHAFDISDVEVGRYISSLTSVKSMMDCDYGEFGELLYENC